MSWNKSPEIFQMHKTYFSQMFCAKRYRDEILRPIVMTFICHHHLMFQHDDSRPPCRKDLWLTDAYLYSQLCHGLHAQCHPFSMFGMLWIDVYDSVFQYPPISSNFTQPLKSWTAFHRPWSIAISTLWKCVANGDQISDPLPYFVQDIQKKQSLVPHILEPQPPNYIMGIQ